MANKSSFSTRGFKSGLLNPYGAEVLICVLISVFFLITSYNKNNFFINLKYYVITFSKPGLTLIAKPFEITKNLFIYINDFKEGIKVGKIKKTLNEVYVEPFANLSDTIYVYVLIFEFDKILNL